MCLFEASGARRSVAKLAGEEDDDVSKWESTGNCVVPPEEVLELYGPWLLATTRSQPGRDSMPGEKDKSSMDARSILRDECRCMSNVQRSKI